MEYIKYLFYFLNRASALMNRVIAIGPVDRGSIPCRVNPKSQKIVLEAALLYTQHCKDQE